MARYRCYTYTSSSRYAHNEIRNFFISLKNQHKENKNFLCFAERSFFLQGEGKIYKILNLTFLYKIFFSKVKSLPKRCKKAVSESAFIKFLNEIQFLFFCSLK